jgi:Tol biopolymer transport system component
VGDPELRVTYLTKDGRMLFHTHSPQTQKMEVYSKSLTSDEKPTVLLSSPGQNFVNPSLSENGKWLMYDNDLTHAFETYVVPYPPSPGKQSARWQVSANGSSGGTFVNHDTEIVYVPADNRVMSVAINASGPTLGIGATKVLLNSRTIDDFDGGAFTTDGRRILVSQRPVSAGVPVTVVTNWTNLIKK